MKLQEFMIAETVSWEKAFGGSGKRTYLAQIRGKRVRIVPAGNKYKVEVEGGTTKGGFLMVGDAKAWAEENVGK